MELAHALNPNRHLALEYAQIEANDIAMKHMEEGTYRYAAQGMNFYGVFTLTVENILENV